MFNAIIGEFCLRTLLAATSSSMLLTNKGAQKNSTMSVITIVHQFLDTKTYSNYGKP